MNTIHVFGGTKLKGSVKIQGSKNAALPILAASILTKDITVLKNCPKISDVYHMLHILEELGGKTSLCEKGVLLDTRRICCSSVSGRESLLMRSSVCLLGALLGRCREVFLPMPGGCAIGKRPIDWHINALSEMGVVFREQKNGWYADGNSMHGATIRLPFPSVGTTENCILAAVLTEGKTEIMGAAKEPEIVALCQYLTACGAKICGAGTATITIEGCTKLCGCDYRIPCDRIVAGTYLFATVGAGGTVFLEEAPTLELKAPMELAQAMGAECIATEDGLFVNMEKRPVNVKRIETGVYPNFPTDLQSAFLCCACVGEGDITIVENLFENRFRIADALKRMGALIWQKDSHTMEVSGVESLHGKAVKAEELRGGAALVLAGLIAQGETTVMDCSYIYRGYENICKDLQELGARIVSV